MPRDPLRRAATGHPGRAVVITSKVQAWGVGYAGRQCHCVADAAATARPAAACRPSEIAGGFKLAPASESESESAGKEGAPARWRPGP